MMEKTVSTKGISKRNAAGIGYITLPLDTDRAAYIRSVYRKGAISVALDDGGTLDDVLITKEAIDRIVFPKSSKGLGSIVFWVNIPKKNQPVIVGTINKNNEFVNLNENEFSFRRDSKFGFVEVSGNGKNSDLNLIVNHNQGRGRINIIASNKSQTAEVNVNSQGDINVVTTNDINISAENSFNLTIGDEDTLASINYTKGDGFEYVDEFKNKVELKKGEVVINTASGKKVTIDDAGGITIDATDDGNLILKAGVAEIELSEEGCTVDVGEKELFLNGDRRVLYAKSDGATKLQQFEDIGISETTFVGL